MTIFNQQGWGGTVGVWRMCSPGYLCEATQVHLCSFDITFFRSWWLSWCEQLSQWRDRWWWLDWMTMNDYKPQTTKHCRVRNWKLLLIQLLSSTWRTTRVEAPGKAITLDVPSQFKSKTKLMWGFVCVLRMSKFPTEMFLYYINHKVYACKN